MKIRLRNWVALAAALPIGLHAGEAIAQAAHTHIGHVTTAFNSAPDGKGLAATATAEGGIALLHANFTAGDLSDLGAI